MSFNINRKVADITFVKSKVDQLRAPQKKYLHTNLFAALDDSMKNSDNRIITVPAHTGSGKTFTIINAIIPSLIEKYSSRAIVFTSPDVGCVDDPYEKFKKEYNGKLIKDHLGEILQIKVYSKDDLKIDLDSDDTYATMYPQVAVAFISMQMLYSLLIDETYKTKFKIEDIIIDEIHYGNGTPSAATMRLDQGRFNSSYHPAWLTTLRSLIDTTNVDSTKKAPRIIGVSGTLTNSQREGNYEGRQVFRVIPELPKDKDSVTFTKGYSIGEGPEAFKRAQRDIEQLINEIKTLVSGITSDTWDKAGKIGVNVVLPAFIFKYAREKSANGITMKGNNGVLKTWLHTIGADYARSTSDIKQYGKYIPNRPLHYISKYDKSVEVIKQANSQSNASRPLGISIMESGNMGWDIPRITAVVNLTKPSAKYVTNMQEQLCARSNRLLFNSSHDEIKYLIANLAVSVGQKRLLAEYVCKMSTSYILYLNSDLMADAYCNFAKNTYSDKEGIDLYMKAIEEVESNNKVVTFPKDKMIVYRKTSYSANSINRTYKLAYCQSCAAAGLLDPETGKTWCEINTRKSREFEHGAVFNDDEWMLEWIHALDLDHLLDGRTVYDENNLVTRCSNTHKAKTWGNKDHLNRYDQFGTVYKITQNTNTY